MLRAWIQSFENQLIRVTLAGFATCGGLELPFWWKYKRVWKNVFWININITYDSWSCICSAQPLKGIPLIGQLSICIIVTVSQLNTSLLLLFCNHFSRYVLISRVICTKGYLDPARFLIFSRLHESAQRLPYEHVERAWAQVYYWALLISLSPSLRAREVTISQVYFGMSRASLTTCPT